MTEALIGFISGVGVSVIAAVLGSMLERRRQDKRRIDQTLFEVYMLLMELQGHYFYIAAAEVRNEEPSNDTKVKAKELAWRIADKLRAEDRAPHLNEILTVLMSEAAFDTAQARHDAMDSLLKKLGNMANPRHAQVLKAISLTNIPVAAAKRLRERKAPGLLWTMMGR